VRGRMTAHIGMIRYNRTSLEGMARSILISRLQCVPIALAWMAASCSSEASHQVFDGDAGSGWADFGSADSGDTDGGMPALPSCEVGDRTEWSGAIPNTAIVVAVCSMCGESYVVAANGSARAALVSVGNGSMIITMDVPPAGIATTAKLADNPTDGTISV